MFSFIDFFVRLTGKNEGMTGTMGMFEFKDGVSVRKLNRNEAEMLPGIGLHCVAIDNNGEDVFEVIPGKIPMPDSALEEVRKSFIASRRVNQETEPFIRHEPEQKKEPDHKPEQKADNIATKYTREQLEKVADESGLRGLREIGDAVGVKGKSIPELIDRILKNQG